MSFPVSTRPTMGFPGSGRTRPALWPGSGGRAVSSASRAERCGSCACTWRCSAAGTGSWWRGWRPWSVGGGCRMSGPGLLLVWPSGHRPYWDHRWRDRDQSAAHPAPGAPCRPSPLHPHDRRVGDGSVELFALDNHPNASAGGFVITLPPRNQMPARMKHRLPRRLA